MFRWRMISCGGIIGRISDEAKAAVSEIQEK
jgi:hypothetical protein